MTARNYGFTLLELMIVVIIIGIVATMVSPQLINVANETSLKSDIQAAQALQNMIDMYVANGNSLGDTSIAGICQTLATASYLSSKDFGTDGLNLRLDGNQLTYSESDGVKLSVSSEYLDLVENLDDIQRLWIN
ncbi:MAG: hypothetical protein ATN34_04565 [Epulopiscium sp. Nele67-Bin002]|nr:MAG: hypothetical protein BEN18_07235 [Epulopiscium sp. Nuni2H_MBin001]OON91272.1 MAG: hypothetical protein ATN34_04565 [Epulopiscium sp. Nele67-Bin002]